MDLVDFCYIKLYHDCLNIINILYKINIIQYKYRLYKHKQKYKRCLFQIIEIGASPPIKYVPILMNGGFFYRESELSFNDLKNMCYL